MTSVSASGGRSPVRLCRIVPQTNDPPAWLKAGRAFSFLAALPAIPLRDIPATGVGRPGGIPRFARQRHGIHVLLQGRQIAFERPCGHPRTSRRELSGEVCNCHLKPSNRSSDSLNDLLNSTSESIASSRDFIEDSALLKASRVVELVSEGSDGFQLLNVLLKPSRRLPNRLQSPLLAPEVIAHLVAQLGKRRWRVMGDPEDGWWVEVDSDGSELPGDWEYDRKGGYVYCSFS